MKVLIADKLIKVGLDWLKKQAGVQVDVQPGLKADELAKIVGKYDGMIIRSGVKVTAEVLANPAKHAAMRLAARDYALTMSWDSVFEGVYAAYETMLPQRD